MRVAIYLHVPAEEGTEKAESQLLHLKAMAARDGWQVEAVYFDRVAFGQEERPEYERMLSDAEQRRFDVLLFWRLECLSRQNTGKTLALLDRFSKRGIRFCSYQEPHLNSSHVLREAVESLIATLARQDRVYIGSRTKAGLAKQKKTGEPGPAGRLGPGRRPVEFDKEKAKKLKEQKITHREIAAACGVSPSTITRFLKNRH